MKQANLFLWNNVSLSLAFAFLSGIHSLKVGAQKRNEQYLFDMEFAQTAQLIVMLSVDYDGPPEFGAGIIFGHEKDRLLIATAKHVVHRGTQQPKNIWITLRIMPGKRVKATVLKYVTEGDLDLAVLSADDLAKQGINACAFSFDRLSRENDLERGDQVIPVGNPNGISWVLPVEPDKISEVSQSQIIFQSTYISSGHSGGALIDDEANLVGMITADAPPYGRAIALEAVMQQLKQWKYPVLWTTASVREDRYDPPLHKAAEKGDLVEIRKLLALCNNPNEIDFHYRTPLHYAAVEGKLEAISLLLKAGASTEVRDFNGYFPLHLAVSQSKVECVKFLVKAGANVNSKVDGGSTSLHLAADTNINPEIANFLIQAGSEVNAQDDDKNTPLHLAIANGNLAMVKALIKGGASVEMENIDKTTPLLEAVSTEKLDIIQFLISSGARVDAPSTPTGPLHMAALYSNNIEIIKSLLKAGAKVNAKNERGDTPLHYAVSRRNHLNKLLEVMTVLLKAGADPNAKNKEGLTALATAKSAQDRLSSSSDEITNGIQAIESLLRKHGGK